jgi:hypothetical protein
LLIDREKEVPMPNRSVEQVLQEYTNKWMVIPGVEGTAIGQKKGKPCITVFSSIEPDKLKDLIPSVIDGCRIFIEHAGTFRSLKKE